MLVSVKTYTFDRVKQGDQEVSKTNATETGTIIVNPDYVVQIIPTPIPSEALLFHVIMEVNHLGVKDFYTDTLGKITIMNK